MERETPSYVKKRVLILGCGNTLFGDDGFGPATATYMQENCKIPRDVYVMDIGTGTSKILPIIALSEKKPQKLIILDAIDMGRKPGDILEVSVEGFLKNRIGGFSSHHFPAKHLLKELQDGGVEVIIIACQVEKVPDVVSPGLSESVKGAVPKAAKIALKLAE
jgi:coenzyme F420 hydrogenase subunit delta